MIAAHSVPKKNWKPVLGLMIVPVLFVTAKVVDSPLVNPVPPSQFMIKAPQTRSILLPPVEVNPYEKALAKCNATVTPDVGSKLTTCGALVMGVFKQQVPQSSK